MNKEIKIKSLLFGLSLLIVGYANAQTTTETQTPATTQSQAANPQIEVLKQKIAANPQDTQSLVTLATAYQDAQDYTSAIATWNQAITLIPDWAPAYYSIGYINQAAKNNEGAKAAYDKYIAKVKQEEVEANKQNLAYAYFFIAFVDKDTNPEKAKQYIAKSLQYDSTNQDALNLSKSLMN